MDVFVPIVTALVGAIVGATVAAGFSRRQAEREAKRQAKEAKRQTKRGIKMERARELLDFLAFVLNRSALEVLPPQAKTLQHLWSKHHRSLHFVGVSDSVRKPLDMSVRRYLAGLMALHQGEITDDEVEEMRTLAKSSAREFFQVMGLSVD